MDIGDLGKRSLAVPISLAFEAESLKEEPGKPEKFLHTMNLNFKPLGWHLFIDFLVILSWRIRNPTGLEQTELSHS